MKRNLLLLSITVMTGWIIGFFILKLPSVVHTLLLLSVVLYIRLLMHNSVSASQKFYRTDKSIK